MYMNVAVYRLNVYPRALLLLHWQRTHRNCGVVSGQVMSSQLGFGGTQGWAAGLLSINRSKIDPTVKFEAHKKATQTSDSETLAMAPEPQASHQLFELDERFVWCAVEGCGSGFEIRLQLVTAGGRW
jgi:hypothetical protein